MTNDTDARMTPGVGGIPHDGDCVWCEENPTIRSATMDSGEVEFDEFIANDVQTVHIEAMGPGASWWIGVTLADGREWHLNLGATNSRAKSFATCEREN